MSATDVVEENTPEQFLNEVLQHTEVSTLRVGQKVLCFQPGKPEERKTTEILQRSTLRTILKRTPGWYVGVVKSIEDGWAIVAEKIGTQEEELTTLWDVNGQEYPVYPLDHLPRVIDEIIHGITHLRELYDEASRLSLEDEFFAR